jgi:ubiquinone/menaquinone biosynthesis C-methylase UbiE
MPYVAFISFLEETNRCPGGKNTIRKILQNSFVNNNSFVLEIGSNTGFTSLEIARTARCKVIGIDPVPEAIAQSQKVLATDIPPVQSLVEFHQASAYDIPYSDNQFDLVVAGGATSFMDRKDRALSEYHRVLKPWSFLSVTNLFYRETPPEHVVRNVSKILGVNIEPWTDKDWLKLFEAQDLFERYHYEVNPLRHREEGDIATYVEYFMQKPHILGLPKDTRAAIRKKWTETLNVFNENHKYLSYMLCLFRKRHLPEEPELF